MRKKNKVVSRMSYVISLKKILFLFFIFTHYLLLTTHYSFAKEINFDASVDRNKVALGGIVQLYLNFDNTQDIPAVDLPQIDGFQAQYVGPTSRISIINTEVSKSITHIYNLLAVKKGTFKLGPFKFDYKGDTYTSTSSINIEVVESINRDYGTDTTADTRVDTSNIEDWAFVVIEINKNRIYLNEILPVTVKLYANKKGNVQYSFPELAHEGLSLGEFERPKQYEDILNGQSYYVIEFNTTVFGTRVGEFKLGPASLQCNLIVKKESKRQRAPAGFEDLFDSSIFDDFWGNYVSYPLSLKSTDIPLTVVPLPEEGRPKDFSGTLGDYRLDVSVGPQEVKVGDPLTIKMTITGEGNLNTVNIPKFESEAGFKVYDPQIKQEKNQKVFEQVIMPMNESIKEVPAVNFSFFDTKTGAYRKITKGPFPISVLKPEKEERAKIIEPASSAIPVIKNEELGRDIIYIKTNADKFRKKGDFVYKNKLFLGFQIIPLLSYILLLIYSRRMRRLKTDIRYARQLAAPRKAKKGIQKIKGFLDKQDTKGFYDALFQTMQEYLGDKLHLPSKSITISVVDEALKNKQIPEDILVKLKAIFADCDMARYAASQFDSHSMQESLKKLEEIIDYFQRAPSLSLRAPTLLRSSGRSNLLLCFLMLNFCLAFAQDNNLTSMFNKANDLYKQNKYDEAIAGYEQIIKEGVDNGSLYYNLGNCYFKKEELGKAMLNYERARLFMPYDSDLKSNYDYTRSLLNLGRQEFPGSRFLRWLDRIFDGININLLAVCLSLLYTLIFLVLILKLFIPYPSPLPFGEREKGEGIFPAGIIRFYKLLLGGGIILFIITGLYFIHRLNYLNKSAVIIVREADAKFEPLESATTYFTLTEGSKIEVMESTGGWRKIKRADGKSGWVKNRELESIYGHL